nr:MAG TPA: hypothetical protein [Caudoviricetes sp.]
MDEKFVFMQFCDLYQFKPSRINRLTVRTKSKRITTDRDKTYRIKRKYKVI